MNKITIDLDEFVKKYRYLNGKKDILCWLKSSDVKLVNCDECENIGETCNKCIHNKFSSDYFKQKQNELDKLFIGAPVVQVGTENGAFVRLLNFNGNKEHKRLPTVEEAPRNVWLAPWLERPEELLDYKNAVWLKSQFHIWNLFDQGWEWEDVEAVMILEDFKK